jgi:hypothetical protein
LKKGIQIVLRIFSLIALSITLTLNVILASPQKYRNRDGVEGNILWGQQYAFSLAEPNGWNLDTGAEKSTYANAVLYPDGSSWDQGVVVMYVRVVSKDSKGKKSLWSVIKNDIKDFKKASKYSKVLTLPSLLTRDKKKVEMRYFYDDVNKNHEAVAYINESRVVVLLVLTSRSKDEYSKSLPAFKDLTASYLFMDELINAK